MTIKIFGNYNINCKPDGTEDQNESFLFSLCYTLDEMGFCQIGSIRSPFDDSLEGYLYVHPEVDIVYHIYFDDLEVFWEGHTLKLYARQPTPEELKLIESINVPPHIVQG